VEILLIDSDRQVVRNVLAEIEAKHHSVDVALDGVTGLHLALSNNYDVVVVGWELPRVSGLDVVRSLRREHNSSVPVLMLASRSDLASKINAFRSGTDDYLTKPFELLELEVRLEALVARSRGRVGMRQLTVGNLTMDLTTLEVFRAGRRLHLYPASWKLLQVLMRESPGAVSREQLEYAVWGHQPPDRDLLRSQISSLRKIVDGPCEEKLIHTLPRFGYRLSIQSSIEARAVLMEGLSRSE
jgi:DNA-binding response OmpR family regulator